MALRLCRLILRPKPANAIVRKFWEADVVGKQTTLYQLIYTSSLAPATSVAHIATIVRRSRTRNAEQGITGTLVFDGQHFCQYLEGPAADVSNLAKRIAADIRHIDFVVRHEGPLDSPRRFPDKSLSYCLATDEQALGALDTAWHEDAVSRLLRILPECECEP